MIYYAFLLSGDTVQVYEYDVYGQVAASDPNHPNPFLFTGRRYDSETGLYYYRARYYNPYIGRFLQTDPIGYGDGMNWYAYCANNPVGLLDRSGLWASYSHNWVQFGNSDEWRLQVLCWNDVEQTSLGTDFYFESWGAMDDYVHGRGKYAKDGPGDFCDVSFDYYVWREWYGIAGSWNGSTGEADHIIDADEWREYLGGVIAQAHDASDDSLILTAGLFDTRIVDDGTPYNVWADTPHDTYCIEPLDIYVKGHELNYIGQGMLYASKGLPKETTVLLPAAWKMRMSRTQL
jgi:RHS repeat-associated protein